MTALPLFDRLSALADPIRGRLLLALERRELTVREIQTVLQLPQSTVSRHLRVLSGVGMVTTRSEGTSNWYRMPARELEPAPRRLWLAVRDEVAGTVAARRDAERLRGVLAERHLRSRSFFDSSAGQWDRLRREFFGERAELLALLGLLDPAWEVGDLGCGTGQVAAALAPFVRRVVAVDESAAMLRAARQRTREFSNVDCREGALEALPIEAAALDAALLMLVLHHVPDPGAVLVDTHRVLRPGGRLLVLDMLPHEHAEYRDQMGHQWLGFDRAQVTEWVRDAGFTQTRTATLPADPEARGPGLFVLIAQRSSSVAPRESRP